MNAAAPLVVGRPHVDQDFRGPLGGPASPFQGEAGEQGRFIGFEDFALKQPEHDRANKGKRDISGDYAQPVLESHGLLRFASHSPHPRELH